jgi:NADH-quinone oxidoreductase subunit E
MAWITKNSAGMQIPKRDKPYMSEALKAQLTAEYLPRYEDTKGALLPVLHAVQHDVGYLPLQALMEVAAFLNLKPADVLDTATFYEEFHLEPVGKYIIGVCQSIACELGGHEPIVDRVRQRLGIEPGETTPDGHITLLCMECLGACDTAPCGLFNEERYDNLTIESIDALLDRALADNQDS